MDVYVVVNTEGDVGAADWRWRERDLPQYDEHDRRYVLTVPAGTPAAKITEQMDAVLGGSDLPDGWVWWTPMEVTHETSDA